MGHHLGLEKLAHWRINFSGYGKIYTGLTYSTLPTVGQAARNENDFSQSFRTFAPQAATGTYWISLLMQKDAVTTNSFGSLLFDGCSEKNFTGQANSDKFSVAGEGAFASFTTVTTTVSLASEPSTASALNGNGGTSFTAFAFDRIRLGKFNDGSGYLDEVRIGTMAADVGLVPEPSTAPERGHVRRKSG